MNNKIIQILKKINGSVLGIGLDDEKMLDAIAKNENIIECFLLNKRSGKSEKKVKIFRKGKEKTIHIKKIRKYFKKKSVDNIVCNYEIVKKFMRGFVSNSVYLNNGKLYLYGKCDNLDDLVNKYKRYTPSIEVIKEKDEFLLIIDNTNSKNGFFKDRKYRFIDFVNDFLDFLTELLIN